MSKKSQFYHNKFESTQKQNKKILKKILNYKLVTHYIEVEEKIKIKMIDRNLQKLKYEITVHHKQNLRNQIDQNMIDQIQISNTPSLNYQKAYQSLYHDQLQKSINLHDQKKNLQQLKKNYDILVAAKHQNVFNISESDPFKNSTTALNIPNLNYRDVAYINYDLLKQTKALDHTLKNYDGGEAFYKNCDIHKIKQKRQQQNMRRTLLKQLNQKQQKKYMQQQKINKQHSAIKNRQQIQKCYKSQVSMQNMNEKIKQRDEILNQIKQQRVKRGRRSYFNYDNMSRHNPITNPIQYHIDNPYILKQIQNQNRN